MSTQRGIIKSVIDRVLWTAGATAQNRRLLADAINSELVKQQPPTTGQYEALFKAAAEVCSADGTGTPTSHEELLAKLKAVMVREVSVQQRYIKD